MLYIIMPHMKVFFYSAKQLILIQSSPFYPYYSETFFIRQENIPYS